MIYDMRIYDLRPGSVDEYMAAVKEVALQIREDLFELAPGPLQNGGSPDMPRCGQSG